MSSLSMKTKSVKDLQKDTREKLQALIVAESFDEFFRPITFDQPRVLLPLVNVPMIDYTFEFLTSAGVEQIYVFCVSHAEKITEYLKKSFWNSLPNLKITPIVSNRANSIGDALREVFNLNIFLSDFILVSGDALSNVDLAPILAQHRARRDKDKEAVMTMLFKPTGTRSYSEDLVIAIDAKTKQLLAYDSSSDETKVEIDHSIVRVHEEIEFRRDLMDCRIAICAPHVLFLLEDNFDFSDLKMFIRGILGNELLDAKLFTHILEEGYAGRAHCFRTYNSISKDLLNRWCYPIVPENNFPGTAFRMPTACVYIDNNVTLSRSCVIGNSTAIGSSTVVGPHTTIDRSVIGRSCKIGSSVTISDSFIWDDVIIEDGVSISQALICSGAIIKSKAKIPKGCVLSYNVVIGPGVELNPFEKFWVPSDIAESNDLQPDGSGRLWQKRAPNFTELVPNEGDVLTSKQTDPKQSKTKAVEYVTELEKFKMEAEETMRRAIKKQHSHENVAVELNALKFAYPDATWVDCSSCVFYVILDSIVDGKELTVKEIVTELSSCLKIWAPLWNRIGLNKEDQIDLIFKIQEYCEQPKNAKFQLIFQNIVQFLYDNEILEEDSILGWRSELEDVEDSEEKKYLNMCKDFLEWLDDADEEDEDDESDEDGDKNDGDGDEEIDD